MNGKLYLLRSTLSALLLALAAGCAVTPGQPQYAEATSRVNSHCLTTGTRIVSKDTCVQSGRSYSQEDLRRTGAITVAEALERLDPTITVGH